MEAAVKTLTSSAKVLKESPSLKQMIRETRLEATTKMHMTAIKRSSISSISILDGFLCSSGI